MRLISIISDFGSKDQYLAELKAAIYYRCNNVFFLDISHEIDLYDISMAAYFLKNMLTELSEDSINIVAVNNFYDKKPKYLVFYRDGKYFVGPNNGIFSLLFENLEDVYEINIDFLEKKDVNSIYAHAAACINHGLPLEEFASPINEVVEKLDFRPVVTSSQIKATIIHIDQYENVITNLTKELFDKTRNGRQFAIYYKPHDPIEILSKHYGEVSQGEALALFNKANHLEIAINMGKASSTLHLFKNETIQIDFQ
jgi:hypothetical protein